MNRMLRTLFLAGAFILGVSATPDAARSVPAEPYDVVIVNARVIDGAGNPWFRADVAVKDGRIARLGRFDKSGAAKIIDAKSQILAPGFIDVHAHVEGIYRLPDAANFTRMGVTSLITGNCGGSETDVAKFLGRMKETPIAVNLGTLIGHNAVRREVMGLDNRAPTPDEQQKMEALVDQALRDGAVGLSTGLIYLPGVYSKTDEVVGLAKVAAKHGGIYATHMRNEGWEIVKAIEESIHIAETAGMPLDISHFKISSKKLWGRSDMTLGMVRAARARGLSVTVDQYVYTASSTSIEARLPDWMLAGGREEGKKRLADPATRAKIVRDIKFNLRERSGFKDLDYAVVANYATNPKFNGKSIKQIAKEARGKDDLDSQIDQMLEMYAAGGAQMVYHAMSEADVQRILREPFTMIAADAGVHNPQGESIPHPRGYGNNVRVLGRYVRELKQITLEDAIRKMTSLPAQTFGLTGRGLIREGFAADLVLFDETTVGDKATFENPHQYAAGLSYVFVNGQPVVADGQPTGARPGQALRGPGTDTLRAARQDRQNFQRRAWSALPGPEIGLNYEEVCSHD
jgi:N-acyl-D-amino-acid deacylase